MRTILAALAAATVLAVATPAGAQQPQVDVQVTVDCDRNNVALTVTPIWMPEGVHHYVAALSNTQPIDLPGFGATITATLGPDYSWFVFENELGGNLVASGGELDPCPVPVKPEPEPEPVDVKQEPTPSEPATSSTPTPAVVPARPAQLPATGSSILLVLVLGVVLVAGGGVLSRVARR